MVIKRRSGPIRVLVEDSPTSRDLLVAIFSQTSDIQVIGVAIDGEEAIRQAANLRPDLITMDVQMPREAIFNKTVDHVIGIDRMGMALTQLPFLPIPIRPAAR